MRYTVTVQQSHWLTTLDEHGSLARAKQSADFYATCYDQPVVVYDFGRKGSFAVGAMPVYTGSAERYAKRPGLR